MTPSAIVLSTPGGRTIPPATSVHPDFDMKRILPATYFTPISTGGRTTSSAIVLSDFNTERTQDPSSTPVLSDLDPNRRHEPSSTVIHLHFDAVGWRDPHSNQFQHGEDSQPLFVDPNFNMEKSHFHFFAIIPSLRPRTPLAVSMFYFI